jgi:hypothetical protein
MLWHSFYIKAFERRKDKGTRIKESIKEPSFRRKRRRRAQRSVGGVSRQYRSKSGVEQNGTPGTLFVVMVTKLAI